TCRGGDDHQVHRPHFWERAVLHRVPNPPAPARSPFMDLLRDIRRKGADLVSCSRAEAEYLAEVPNDPTRKLIRQVLGAVAEFERSLIRLRLSRGRAVKAAQGGFAYGSPPFGYRTEGGKLVKDSQEQATITRARRLRERGLSLRQIANELNTLGAKP